MPTPCETAQSPATAGVTPVARAVAEDLEAIFPHEPPAQSSATLRLRERRGRSGRRRGARASLGHAGTAGALAAAALAGVSAGAMIGRSQAPPPARSTPQPLVQASTQSLPNPGPLVPSGPLHAPPPRVLVAKTAPVVAPRPAKLHKAADRHPSGQRRSVHRATRGPSVMQADARLRRSYDAARRAGVSSTVLTDYHDRWDSLRRRAPREPRLVAARYDAMAEDLDQLAERHHAEAARSHYGPWRTLKTQIASLWR